MNNKASFDYLKLQGAEVRSAEVNGKVMNCLIIPVAWNGIRVNNDEKTGEIVSATQYVREWETNQKFKDACVANHQSEADYLPPSHQISVAHPEELEKAYKKRIREQVMADAAFMANNPTEEDINRQVNIQYSNMTRIGYVTPIKPTEAPVFNGVAPAVTTGAYIPTAGEVQPGDDLPF